MPPSSSSLLLQYHKMSLYNIKSQNLDMQRSTEREFLSFCRKQKERMLNKAFLQKYRNNRKKLFLQKEVLSAETASFCRPEVPFIAKQCLILRQSGCRKRLFLPKEHLSAETASFCRKTERTFLIRKSFCRISAEIFGRKAAERPFRLTTRERLALLAGH